MSKLSPALKACINAPFARPGTVPAPPQIRSVYEAIEREAAARDVGLPSWLAISTAATVTMNSPDSMTELHRLASSSKAPDSKEEEENRRAVYAAELMREVGLKCISFNGIPRTINCLGAFRASLPSSVVNALSTTGTRIPTPITINAINHRGHSLWSSIYHPFDSKLLDKLGQSHPDLPLHILYSHYSQLLADFPPASSSPSASTTPNGQVGRVLTSIVAIACLRAQTGVGPQVVSHVFGLRKAFEDVDASTTTNTIEGKAEQEEQERGGKWLASDEGSLWILKCVDAIVHAIGGGAGTSFAPGLRAKL